jgi:hypothetical protein
MVTDVYRVSDRQRPELRVCILRENHGARAAKAQQERHPSNAVTFVEVRRARLERDALRVEVGTDSALCVQSLTFLPMRLTSVTNCSKHESSSSFVRTKYTDVHRVLMQTKTTVYRIPENDAT